MKTCQLALAKVKPGMILADVLLDLQGNVLLPEGTELTEATLALMPRHGIGVLSIQLEARSPAELEAERAAYLERIERRFRKHDETDAGDRATALLRRYITNYRLEQGQEAA